MRRRRPGDDVNKRIAKRLEVRRKLFGICAERMASVSGLTVIEYERLEAGAETITADQLLEFAHLLSVPIKYFLREE